MRQMGDRHGLSQAYSRKPKNWGTVGLYGSRRGVGLHEERAYSDRQTNVRLTIVRRSSGERLYGYGKRSYANVQRTFTDERSPIVHP